MNLNTLYSSGLLLTTVLLVAGCSSGSGSSTPSTSNPVAALGTEVVGHMKSAVPSMPSSLTFDVSQSEVSPYATANWDTANSNLYSPGCTQNNQSLKSYLHSVLDPEYKCGDFAPTSFGRFSQSLKVLSVVGAQVPFANGAPAVGTHKVKTTINVEGQSQEVSFDVVVTSVTSDNFDVKLTITSPINFVAFMKNRNNVANIVSIETEMDGVTVKSRGIDILYWNKSTGALTYAYASRKDSNGEIQKLVITADGKARIGHYVINQGGNVHLLVDLPAASKSTSASIGFEQTGSAIDATHFCATVSTMAASSGACGGAIDITNWRTGAVQSLTGSSVENLLATVFGGAGSDSEILAKTPNFTLTGFETL